MNLESKISNMHGSEFEAQICDPNSELLQELHEVYNSFSNPRYKIEEIGNFIKFLGSNFKLSIENSDVALISNGQQDLYTDKPGNKFCRYASVIQILHVSLNLGYGSGTFWGTQLYKNNLGIFSEFDTEVDFLKALKEKPNRVMSILSSVLKSKGSSINDLFIKNMLNMKIPELLKTCLDFSNDRWFASKEPFTDKILEDLGDITIDDIENNFEGVMLDGEELIEYINGKLEIGPIYAEFSSSLRDGRENDISNTHFGIILKSYSIGTDTWFLISDSDAPFLSFYQGQYLLVHEDLFHQAFIQGTQI